MPRPLLARLAPSLVLGALALATLLLPDPRPVVVLAHLGRQRALPPLTPRWAYEPWVWEDEDNNSAVVASLVDDYRVRDIPVGVVIVDSPWQMPGEFVVDASGTIRVAYRYQYCEDFPDPRVLTAALREVRR